MQEDLKIIVCPSDQKNKILKEICNDSKLHNIKFMNKNEFINNYFFSYDDRALYYLMNKYKYNLDVCKVYLNNMYVIDIDKDYKSSKLEFLKKLKIELIDNKLLKFNYNFKNYIKNKNIEVINYFDLDKYVEEALNYKVQVPSVEFNTPVYEFSTMEDEVNFVCLKIIELINNGVSLNKIFLSNVSSDYLFTISKLFSYYNIPINIDFKDSIYGTSVISNYLKTREIDLENTDNNVINKKLINILGELSSLDSNNFAYEIILRDKLKNTYLPPKILDNAVNIKDLYNYVFDDDEYVFVLGFNQDSLPKMEKDINYINDSIKFEVSMYDVNYLNKRGKEVVVYLLSRIKNLFLSYKKASYFSSFYRSSLINDYSLDVISYDSDNYSYSNIYNKLRLGEMLDLYNLYGEKNEKLVLLNSSYDIGYKSYDNVFTGINNDTYLTHLPEPLKLSYTSLNSYNECRFKYYIKNVLKLDSYTDTFAAFIGSMYHKILSLYLLSGFDLEVEYQKYLDTRELSLKERVLLIKIKKDLIKLIDVLKKQQLLTGYDEFLFEKYAEVELDKKVSVKFIGFIDKIMYYKKVEDTYFSIIDYKSGTIDTHIEPMKYGLHMQLPVYLYLIHYSKIFTNPIFTGIYYQNILFNYPTWSPKLESEVRDKYLLKGYSCDDTSILERFDSTFYESQYIKSMKYSDEKGFGTYSKVIDNDTLYKLVKYTKDHIDNKTDEILDGNFNIDPKVYAGVNVSCNFCSFKDLCFMKNKDLIYLDKQDDLSFLGGDL